MKFLNRNEIDTKQWDKRIAASPIENVFCYSWYLDAAAVNWGAFVSENYETIVPIPFTQKLGIKSFYTPAFSREIDIFGDEFEWNEVLFALSRMFRSIHFRNSSNKIESEPQIRKHQYLKLNEEIKYSTNAKRLIKKGKETFYIEESTDPERLIQLFKDTSFRKIDSISDEDLTRLKELMNRSLENIHGELFEVYADNEMVAGGYFLRDKERITYLKGASTDEAKKQGAMFFLMDFAIQRYKDSFETFDFGGSDVENVANFYKKFGATDRTYYNYNIDNLPLWYKTLKRLKG